MSDDVTSEQVVAIMEDYYGTHANSVEAAFIALARDYATLKAERDRLAADLEAVRRVEAAMDTIEVDKSNDGRFRAFNLSRSVLVFADSLHALGRALAEREGA